MVDSFGFGKAVENTDISSALIFYAILFRAELAQYILFDFQQTECLILYIWLSVKALPK